MAQSAQANSGRLINQNQVMSAPTVSSIECRSIPGGLAPQNADSIDWSRHGFISLGCQTMVVICRAEPHQEITIFQTLHRHKSYVSRTAWPQLPLAKEENQDSSPLLVASCDIRGTIIIWNMLDASVYAHINSSSRCLSKNIVDMKWTQLVQSKPKWLSSKSTSDDCLLVLYSSSVLVMYDTELGDMIWIKDFSTYRARSFSLDPYNPGRVLMCQKSPLANSHQNPHAKDSTFFLVEDAATRLTPLGLSVDFCIRRGTLSRSESVSESDPLESNEKISHVKHGQYSLRVTRYHNNQTTGEQMVASNNNDNDQNSSITMTVNQCTFNLAIRNQAIAVVDRELLIIDVELEHILFVVKLESNIGPVTFLHPCQQRNIFYTMHESGAVAVRYLRYGKFRNTPEQLNSKTRSLSLSSDRRDVSNNDSTLNYYLLCQSDSLRQAHQGKISGFSVSPLDETRSALLMTNGKIIILQLGPVSSTQWPKPTKNLSTLNDPASPSPAPPLSNFFDMDRSYDPEAKEDRKFQLTMSQMLSFAHPEPTTIRMGPPATVRNWKFHKPLLAVGNASGAIQVFNLASGEMYRDLAVHSYPVCGIEWVCLNAFISYAASKPSCQNNEISWELNLTIIESGQTATLRHGRGLESTIVRSVRVSHLRQYFIIVFRDSPFEIWDLSTLSLLRLVPRRFAGIVAAEWSPLYSRPVEDPPIKESSTESNESCANHPTSPCRENFVVTNKYGELFHFSIAGNIVKEILRIPPETTMNGTTTAIAWKSDHFVLGDGDGHLTVWDLKEKESRAESTMRGTIKKIRFAPGRGNMKILILFDDGVDIWDARRLRRLANVKSPRDHLFKIVDIDWASSDRPVILNSEGVTLVTDLDLKQFTSPKNV